NYKAKKNIDARHCAVMPGLINSHTHAAMTLMRGLADDLPLDTWWNKVMFPIEKKFASPEFIRTGVSLAAIEMIKSGTTSFSDMYFFEDDAAEVCKKIGIRAFLGEGILDFPTPSCKSPDGSIKYIEELYKKWKDDPIIHLEVAPHAPYTCSPEVLLKSKALAEKLNLPLHIHVAETLSEVKQIKEKYGKPPVKHLEDIGFLDENVMAVHCVHLDPHDIEILAKHKVKVVHCQESNMKLASGIAPIVDLQKAGVICSLGTDGAASNNNLDMFDEMDTTAKFHKIVHMDPTVMGAGTVLKMATIDGAKVLGKEGLIGSLAKGKAADIIIVDLRRPHLTPVYNVYSHIVYSAGGSDVDTVIVNGKLVMEKRKLLTVDEEKVMDDANRFAEKIKKERGLP
ncbi:MAG: amidohydrolase, partial [Candidatus Saganbacteria bacterium]|nr:amidohydrolase [Candidatus Saganbacteria bacterium]